MLKCVLLTNGSYASYQVQHHDGALRKISAKAPHINNTQLIRIMVVADQGPGEVLVAGASIQLCQMDHENMCGMSAKYFLFIRCFHANASLFTQPKPLLHIFNHMCFESVFLFMHAILCHAAPRTPHAVIRHLIPSSKSLRYRKAHLFWEKTCIRF